MATRLRAGEVVLAPHLINVEVGQGLRRFALHSELTAHRATSLLADFLELPIKRYPHGGLVVRAFEFRSNVTVYDGLYLALAEAVKCPLLTGDAALADVPGCKAVVEVLPTSA